MKDELPALLLKNAEVCDRLAKELVAATVCISELTQLTLRLHERVEQLEAVTAVLIGERS